MWRKEYKININAQLVLYFGFCVQVISNFSFHDKLLLHSGILIIIVGLCIISEAHSTIILPLIRQVPASLRQWPRHLSGVRGGSPLSSRDPLLYPSIQEVRVDIRVLRVNVVVVQIVPAIVGYGIAPRVESRRVRVSCPVLFVGFLPIAAG